MVTEHSYNITAVVCGDMDIVYNSICTLVFWQYTSDVHIVNSYTRARTRSSSPSTHTHVLNLLLHRFGLRGRAIASVHCIP